MEETAEFSGKIYTADKNFTRPRSRQIPSLVLLRIVYSTVPLNKHGLSDLLSHIEIAGVFD